MRSNASPRPWVVSLVSLQPLPTPSHDDLLVAWSKFLGDPDALCAHFNITATLFLALIADPAFIEKKAQWEALKLAQLHTLALDCQAAAAKLRERTASADPVEARKAATPFPRWWPGPPQVSRSSRSRASSTAPTVPFDTRFPERLPA